MAYDIRLADRVRKALNNIHGIHLEEKTMFGGMAFLVNGKMCINVSGDNLMCRFDPANENEMRRKKGYLPMIMKGRLLKGYCYIEPAGYAAQADFNYFLKQCLAFNKHIKAAKS